MIIVGGEKTGHYCAALYFVRRTEAMGETSQILARRAMRCSFPLVSAHLPA